MPMKGLARRLNTLSQGVPSSERLMITSAGCNWVRRRYGLGVIILECMVLW
jgi:hypothetical protein